MNNFEKKLALKLSAVYRHHPPDMARDGTQPAGADHDAANGELVKKISEAIQKTFKNKILEGNRLKKRLEDEQATEKECQNDRYRIFFCSKSYVSNRLCGV